MLPKIQFNQFSIDVEKAANLNGVDAASAFEKAMGNNNTTNAATPMIPPRGTRSIQQTQLPRDPDEVPMWFVVLSPREIRGSSGPYNVADLRHMYRHGEINDDTLLWKEGDHDWQLLKHQRLLRPKLLHLPQIPLKVGTYIEELDVFDPIVATASPAQLKDSEPLKDVDLNRTCSQCGNMAAINVREMQTANPDLFKIRQAVGTTKAATEILPGFLWIGGHAAAGKRTVLDLGLTLLINFCTTHKNPPPVLPYFRCREAGPSFPENPTEDFNQETLDSMLEFLEKICDWIELERISPEKACKADPIPKPFRGNTNNVGIPILTEKPFRKLKNGEKTFAPRVLLWSRLGVDRPCMVCCAYLIKHYGLKLPESIQIVSNHRRGTELSIPYLKVLEQWGKRYSLGTLYCMDCKMATLKLSDMAEVVGEGEHTKKAVMSTLHMPKVQGIEAIEASFAVFEKTMAGSFADKLEERPHEIAVINKPSDYIEKITVTLNETSPWTGLIDLVLPNRNLSDVTIAHLFNELAANNLLRQLRIIDLHANQIKQLALRAMLIGYFPLEGEDLEDDDDYNLPWDLTLKDLKNDMELMVLDVSLNQIDDMGARYLTMFLKQCNTLSTLDVSNNNLGDDVAQELIYVFEKPAREFVGTSEHDDDDSGIDSLNDQMLHNYSVTNLNCGGNNFGWESMDALVKVIKNNAVISTLSIECSPECTPQLLDPVFHAIRLYNPHIETLILSETPLSVKNMENVAKMTEAKFTNIKKLDLSNSGMKYQHLEKVPEHLHMAENLRHLNLSNNKLTDKAAKSVSALLMGKLWEGKVCPPLEHVDLTNCGFTGVGCTELVTAAAQREKFQYLDLSNNSIGSDHAPDFVKALAMCTLSDVRMNMCNLGTKGAVAVFNAFADPNSKISLSCQSLYLSGNEINDSAGPALCSMLENNMFLEILDLGFNLFTNDNAAIFKKAILVTSSTSEAKKAFELHINMMGNECDPYIFDTPGMARAKSTFKFGIQPNYKDPLNGGFSHITASSRGHFLVRKAVNVMHKEVSSANALNMIS